MACRHQFVRLEAPAGAVLVKECMVCGMVLSFRALPASASETTLEVAVYLPDGTVPPPDVDRLVRRFLRDVGRDISLGR